MARTKPVEEELIEVLSALVESAAVNADAPQSTLYWEKRADHNQEETGPEDYRRFFWGLPVTTSTFPQHTPTGSHPRRYTKERPLYVRYWVDESDPEFTVALAESDGDIVKRTLETAIATGDATLTTPSGIQSWDGLFVDNPWTVEIVVDGGAVLILTLAIRYEYTRIE